MFSLIQEFEPSSGLFRRKGQGFELRIFSRSKEGVSPEDVVLLMSLRHPNILPLRYVIETKEVHSLVEEIEGKSMTCLLHKKKNLAKECVRLYAEQLLDALCYMHSKGIRYAKLSPENMLVKGDHIWFVPCCAASNDFLPITPEMCAKEENYLPYSDMWGLAILIYALACGVPPFFDDLLRDFSDVAVLEEEIAFPEDVDESCVDLLRKMLHKDYGERMTSAEEIRKHDFFRMSE